MKNLPIGVQTFDKLINGGFLYIDKTKYIYNLITKGSVYFLSRPRRFGKSLLISTLAEIFKGNKKLFKGLWLANSDWQWDKYPIIRIDFSGQDNSSPEKLKIGIKYSLINNAKDNNIIIDESLDYPQMFFELIRNLSKKNKVIVLVDEYDKALIDVITNKEVSIANREILRAFYSIIKAADEYIKFVFLTGVTKFSRVSVFSGLNNLKDITMDTRYAGLCGYDQEELEYFFKDYINSFIKQKNIKRTVLLEEIKNWYNGYRFSSSEEKVYNPFSVLLFFDTQEFKTYWFQSATPTFLIKLLEEKESYLPSLENFVSNEESFSSYEIENIDPIPILFQTGYLTIKSIQGNIYTLDYPNYEVKNSFLTHLYNNFSKISAAKEGNNYLFLNGLLYKEKYDSFFEIINSIYASIPYTLMRKPDESYFHTIFYLMLSITGANASSEVLTSDGRIDLVIEYKDKIFIIEFKCKQSAKAALKQIKDKNYCQPYLVQNKPIFFMGINFDRNKKQIAEYKILKHN